MYCIKCGVELADTEKVCPLCQTVVFHPDVTQPDAPPLYPKDQYPKPQVTPLGGRIILTTLFLLAMLIPMQCDLHLTDRITWSGFVIASLLFLYVCTVLPFWFRRPNPVIFVPCGFAAAAGLLLYICLATGGHWFLTFALPTVGAVALIVTAVVTLLKYVGRGELYIFGGAMAAMGAYMPVMGWLVNLTFLGQSRFAFWSLYPATALVLLGGMLIFLAICRPARETMQRKLFI